MNKNTTILNNDSLKGGLEISPSFNIYDKEQGYFYIGNIDKQGKFKQLSFKCEEILKAQGYINNNTQNNIYNTCAVFKSGTYRGAINVKKVLINYIDIDNHINGCTEAQAQELLDYLEPLFDIAIPRPSLFIYTGRGVQLQFKLNNSSDITKFTYIQRGLNKKIEKIIFSNNKYILFNVKGLEIDKLEDSARLLRTANTLNTKSNTYTRVLYSSDTRYTQDEIIEAFNLDYTREKGKNKGKETHLKDLVGFNLDEAIKTTRAQYNGFKSYIKKEYTRESLNLAKQQDLFKLASLRSDRGYKQGYRNKLIACLIPLFIEANTSLEDIRQALEELNGIYEPLSDSEVKGWIRQAQFKRFKGAQSNKYLINYLEITEEEQSHLKAIISVKERNRRYYSKNKEVVKAKAKLNYRGNKEAKIEKVKKYNAEHQESIKLYKDNYYKDNKGAILDKANNKYKPIKTINKMNKAIKKAQAIEMYKQGIDYKTICNKLEITKSTLYRYVKEG